MSHRIFNWKPDVPDFRDHYFKISPPASGLPQYVPIIGNSNRIEDQGNLGSCVGNSATSCLEIVTKSRVQLSRLMAYYNARLIEGNVKYDDGCYIRDAIKGFMDFGCCYESKCKYDIKKFAKKPTATAYKNAEKIKSKVSSYERLVTLNQLKTSLANGSPVIFGFSVPEYFISEEMMLKAWLPLPTNNQQMIGGHAVLAVGYDIDSITKEEFIWIRNSWGDEWGINGYFKMPVTWFTDERRLVDDLWTIHTV